MLPRGHPPPPHGRTAGQPSEMDLASPAAGSSSAPTPTPRAPCDLCTITPTSQAPFPPPLCSCLAQDEHQAEKPNDGDLVCVADPRSSISSSFVAYRGFTLAPSVHPPQTSHSPGYGGTIQWKGPRPQRETAGFEGSARCSPSALWSDGSTGRGAVSSIDEDVQGVRFPFYDAAGAGSGSGSWRGAHQGRAVVSKREESLAEVKGEHVRNAIYEIIKLPPFCYDTRTARAMDGLAACVRVASCAETSIVDADGNPWSEHILAFLNGLVVLYRSVTLDKPGSGPWLDGDGMLSEEGEVKDDEAIEGGQAVDGGGRPSEMDKKAFGAVMATTHAARILILITHAHNHILRALWFALVYLSLAYSGTRRGVALDFLLDRVFDEWTTREDQARAKGRSHFPSTSAMVSKAGVAVDEEWMRRARRVGFLLDKRRFSTPLRSTLDPSGKDARDHQLQVDVETLDIKAVWAEMKGANCLEQCHSGRTETTKVDGAGVEGRRERGSAESAREEQTPPGMMPSRSVE